MNYFNAYRFLKEKVNYEEDIIKLDDLDIYNYSFNSYAHSLLPGKDNYCCEVHKIKYTERDTFYNDIGTIDETLLVPDSDVETNKTFRYHIFKPRASGIAEDLILLFHGFNEKHWDKYLPWAEKIALGTKKPVVLFPIAFHMNRAPQDWVEKRKMFELSEMRKKKFPDIVNSALSNVAISMRLHSMPQRFIWSGLQTYYDVIQFVEECKSGRHPLFEKDCSINFFSYSIGCFLAEIIKMTNVNGYFDDSKLCLFCGGPVFNRLSPVSKFILDSEANVALYSYLVEHLSSHKKSNNHLQHILDIIHPEGYNFHCMLDFKIMREYRENLFRKIQDNILAISLKKDTVIPSYEVINTLQGISRDIKIPVEIYDFPYNYIHEDPFPIKESIRKEVNENFEIIFNRICSFLK